MKYSLILFTALWILTGFSSLASAGQPVKKQVFGCCACAAPDARTIELQLNEDATFSYVDSSNPSHAVSIKGKWTLKKDRICLQPENYKGSFHSRWKYTAGGSCIKSRHKMNFRRICLTKSR